MTYTTTVNADGQIQLGEAAERAGFKPGSVVEIIVASSGSLTLAPDTSPPAMDVPFRRLPARPSRRALAGGTG